MTQENNYSVTATQVIVIDPMLFREIKKGEKRIIIPHNVRASIDITLFKCFLTGDEMTKDIQIITRYCLKNLHKHYIDKLRFETEIELYRFLCEMRPTLKMGDTVTMFTFN